jgi:hypothetical protein
MLTGTCDAGHETALFPDHGAGGGSPMARRNNALRRLVSAAPNDNYCALIPGGKAADITERAQILQWLQD